MVIIENATTCVQCEEWCNIEEMVVEKGDYFCGECRES